MIAPSRIGRLSRRMRSQIPRSNARTDRLARANSAILRPKTINSVPLLDRPSRFHLSASHVVLVFDADRDAIYRGGSEPASDRCASRDEQARRLFASLAIERGIHVIEMDPIFRTYYAATGKHLDYLPVGAHWNGAARILAAKEVANVQSGSMTAKTHLIRW